MMAFAMIKTKTYFKKGIEKDIIGTKFKILDTRMLGGATQNIVEMYDNDERGIEIADFWRPNKNKVCTVLIKKPKEHDEKFVSILAKRIIQPTLDCIISGRSLDTLINVTSKKVSEGKPTRNHKDNVCK